MALPEVEIWSSLIQNLCVSIASIGAFILALYGVKSWLREFRGKRDTELCEEVLEKFYQAQEAIRWMRSPFVFSTELKKDRQSSSERSEQDQARANVQVLFDRYNAKSCLAVSTLFDIGLWHGSEKTRPSHLKIFIEH